MTMLSERFSDQELSVYNALGDVEDATAILERRDNFHEFLQHFSLLAVEESVEDCVGAFLLHRHFELVAGALMLERTSEFDGAPALITSPSSEWADVEVAPVRWKVEVQENGSHLLRALEFSADSGAIEATRSLASHSRFLCAYADLLREFELEELIGLAVVGRALIPCHADQVYVERNSDDASVVTVEPDTGETIGIVTTWVPKATAYCTPRYRCEGLYRCQQICSGFDERYTGSCKVRSHSRVLQTHAQVSQGHDRRTL